MPLLAQTEAFSTNHVQMMRSSELRASTMTNSNQNENQSLFYAAAGAPSVDMNRYNLPLDKILDEWTALLTPKTTLTEEGIYLNAKNSKEFFVDRLDFQVKRAGGLGLVLTEIAGGRSDGVGITIIEEILGGSNSEGCGFVPGDSIVALSVEQSEKTDKKMDGMLESSAKVTQVSTECLCYDATIEALTSLPPPENDDEEITITVKRMRKKPRVSVKLQFPPDFDEPDTTIELFSGENLRRAMLTRGVKLNDALSRRFDSGGTGDCGAEGTCATCAVNVVKGMELLNPIKTQEQQIFDKKPQWRMACKAVVGYGMTEGEMTVQVSPKRW